MSAVGRDDLLRPALGVAGATLIVAGPWLAFVAVFGLASLRLEPLVGRLALEDLRLTVVYAFSIAPLLAAPVAGIAARIVDVDSEAPYGSLRGVVLSALCLAGVLSMATSVGVVVALRITPVDLAIAFVFFSGAVGQLWVIFAVLAARRAYGLLIKGFLGCLGAAAAALLALAGWDTPVSHMVWLLDAGIVAYIALGLARLARDDPRPADLAVDLPVLVRDLRQHRILALGIFCAMAAVWVDKWLKWAGASGMHTTAGFYHYAPYDTVMFLAHAMAIPTLVALHGLQRTTLARATARLHRRLADGSTRHTLQAEQAAFQNIVWGGLTSILALNLAVTGCGILLIPWVAPLMSLDFGQVLTLRIGLLAVFCHSLLVCCGVLLLQTRSTRNYLWVNGLMLGLNLCFGLTIQHGAWGLFFAALASSGVALFLALREMNRLLYLHFIGENDALYQPAPPKPTAA